MATAASARLSADCGHLRTQRCASQPQFSSRVSGGVRHSAVNSHESRRSLALEATCLDQVDFGVQATGVALGGNFARLLLRRNEVKDLRKRWSSSKILGDHEATSAMASSALAAKLADRQPAMSRIVLRSQHVRTEAEQQRSVASDLPSSKRIRQRDQ